MLDYDGAVEFAREYLESRSEYFAKGPEVRIMCLRLSHRIGQINLLQSAHEDAEDSQALREEAAQLIEAGEPLPRELACYVGEFLRNPYIPKRNVVPRDQTRDLYISMAVWQVMDRTGWRATRGRARTSKSVSACQVVAAALEQLKIPVSEDSVDGIWRRYKHMEPSEK